MREKRYRKMLVWEWRDGGLKFFRPARCLVGPNCRPICAGCVPSSARGGVARRGRRGAEAHGASEAMPLFNSICIKLDEVQR
jgi:hypothetical protein